MSTRAEAAWVVLGFAALSIVATYPLVLAPGHTLAGDLGDPLLTAWTLAWDADRLRHGLRGLWDAPSYFPYRHTLLYSDHLLGVAIFTAPLQWLTTNAVLAYNAAYLASAALSGGAMYLLARELTGRRDAAVAAGVVYAMQPFRASHLPHLQWLITGWLPLSLWALHRYFRAPRTSTLLACAAFFLLQATTASYFAYFALLPLMVVGCGEWWRHRLPASTVLRDGVPAIVLAAVVLLPIARGYGDLRAEQGLKRSTADIAAYSADVADYLSASPDLKLWGGLGPGRGEHELFVGGAAMLLAVLAIVCCWRAPAVALYAILIASAFALSLGPRPTAWGHALGVPGPYALFLRVVPGLDGLRAIARLAVVVQVAVAVLAAFGVAWLLDRVRGSARAVACTAIVIVVCAEGWATPIRVTRFEPNPIGAERDAYAYLSGLPAGAVLELPTSVEDFNPEFLYQYRTLTHKHPVVNGHSSYVTPLLQWLGGGHSPFREVERQHDAIAAVRGVGVRYLVVHRASFTDPVLADALLAAVDADTDQVIARRAFGDVTVAVLAPLDQPVPPATREIPSAVLHARASHSEDRLPQLFDGDADSRWISSHPQSGDEWVQLDFDHARDVRVVRLQLGARSFGDYPRELEIEARGADGSRTLFRGTVLPHFARGLLIDGAYPWIEIVLPENQSRSIRLRQRGTARTFFWSIHELRLLERL